MINFRVICFKGAILEITVQVGSSVEIDSGMQNKVPITGIKPQVCFSLLNSNLVKVMLSKILKSFHLFLQNIVFLLGFSFSNVGESLTQKSHISEVDNIFLEIIISLLQDTNCPQNIDFVNLASLQKRSMEKSLHQVSKTKIFIWFPQTKKYNSFQSFSSSSLFISIYSFVLR